MDDSPKAAYGAAHCGHIRFAGNSASRHGGPTLLVFGAGAQTAASIRKHITRRLTATFHELAEIGDVSRADLCDLVLVQLTGHLAIDLETVRTVRSAAPLSRCVGFFDDNTTTQLAVHAVQRLGLPTVNVMSPDLAEQLLCEWEAAQQENIAAVLRRIWLPLCSHRISGLLELSIELSAAPTTVSQLADIAGVPQRTIEAWFAAERLPTPCRCIGWCRVLRAIWLLERANLPLKTTAALLGFASPATLGATISRYLGDCYRELSRQGAFDTATKLLLSSCSSFREVLSAPTQRSS